MRVTEQPTNTDEWFDTICCRPLANRVTDLIEPTGLSANGATLIAGLFGALAGVGFAGTGWWPAAGAASLFAMMIFDCVDGELARRQGGGGWRGRILDGLADLVTAFSIHLGMLIHLIRSGLGIGEWDPGALELFVFVLAAGAAMSWNCAVVDDMKQRLKEHSVDRDWEKYASEVNGVWDRFLYWTLKRYVRWTQQSTGPARPGGPRRYRLAQWVGPTHHHLAIAIAGALTPIWESSYVVYLVVALVPANIWLLVVLKTGASPQGEPDPSRR